MNKLKYSVITICAILFFQPAEAQLLNRLRERAEERVEEKIEERAEEKLDEKIDEGLDELEESMENSAEQQKEDADNNSGADEAQMQQRMQGILSGMGFSTEPVPVADNYKFDQLIQMHIESTNESGEKINDGEFITHLDSNSKAVAYEVISGDIANPGQGKFIVDADNGATIILNDEDKTGIVYGTGAFFQSIGETYNQEELEDTPETYLANPKVTKTGNTKTIAGYDCEEYIYTDEETVSHIWITKDMKMNTQDFFSSLFKTSLYSQGIGWGYMMEVTSKEMSSGEETVMQVTKVDPNSNINFSLDDYEITNIGSFQMPAEE